LSQAEQKTHITSVGIKSFSSSLTHMSQGIGFTLNFTRRLDMEMNKRSSAMNRPFPQ
jgi:hypothetical protein